MLTRLRSPTWRSATLAMALSTCATLAPAQGSADAAAATRSPALPELLLGILHYTRWPQPLASHRLCLNEVDADAVALARELDAQGAQAVPPVHSAMRSLRADLADSLLDCQAIYFGAMPVRCLLQGAQGWQIKANLDAIAYSGLRVNARLLQLTVRPAGGRP